ncbi:MAG: PD40 domain-containing protein, partial [SAR324 cluster bacterium]|nr:PD40 domain-containing protein [SAR324 cluster bacterium]
MKRFTIIAMCLVLLSLFEQSTFAQNAHDLFQKALVAERTQGDLDQAIQLYKQIIANHADDRALAAKALLQMGGCYEKLGNTEAQKAYGRIVEEYADQSATMAQARTRLAVLISSVGSDKPLQPKFTKIKIPTRLSRSVKLSPDGKNLTLVSDKKLWKLPLSGNLGPRFSGIPVQLNTEGIEVDHQAGLSWSGDGKWIAFHEFPSADTTEKEKNNQSIFVVSSKGGKPTKVSETYSKGRIENFWISLSPDGKTLAHSSINNNGQYVFSTPVDGGTSKQLVDIQSREPAFSSDGKWIAYVEDKNFGTGGGNLWIVPAVGGEPKLIAKAGYATSPVWSPDNSMIAFVDDDKKTQINLVEVPLEGQENSNVIRIDAPEGMQGVSLLAGWTSENKIGAVLTKKVENAIYSLPVQGGMATVVLSDCWAMMPRWSPNGSQIYYTSSEIKGSQKAFQLTLASVPANGGTGKFLAKDKGGKKVWQLGNQGGNRISPDGKTIISAAWQELIPNINFPRVNLWKISTDGLESEKITDKKGHYFDASPSWSPDGKNIAFIRAKLKRTKSSLLDTVNIITINSSGSEEKILVTVYDKFIFSLVWSPDGKMLAYLSMENKAPKTKQINFINAENGAVMFSWEVPSADTDIELAWAPDSKRIAINDGERKVIKIMTVNNGNIEDIKTNLGDVKIRHIDWSPDGERFVFAGKKRGEAGFWFMENFLPLDKLAQKTKVAEETPKVMTIKKVWAGPDVDTYGTPSPDGKYLSYTDWETGDLAIRELATGKTQRLTNKGTQKQQPAIFALNSVISPDNKLVAYSWTNEYGTYDLCLIGIDGSGIRILYNSKDKDEVYPVSWSSDGRQIAARRYSIKGEKAEIISIAVADGTVQVLKTFEKSFWPRFSYSPDDRYIAYDFPVEETSGNHDISLIPSDGSSEISIIEHPANDRLLGWALGKKEILFLSDRSGTWDAWIIKVDNGKPLGTPQRIKPDLGQVSPMAFTQNGSFYFSIHSRKFTTQIAPFDLKTGKVQEQLSKPILGSHFVPEWSPDGEYLTYVTELTEAAGPGNYHRPLHVLNLGTEEEHELAGDFEVRVPRWSLDGRYILFTGYENKHNQKDYNGGVYKIDVQTGDVTELVQFPPVQEPQHINFSRDVWWMNSIADWSHDGKSIFYINRGRLFVRELESGQEKQ